MVVFTPSTLTRSSAAAIRLSASAREAPGGDQLEQQRVVVDRDRASRLDARLDPDPFARGELEPLQRARRGQEAFRRVLSIHSTLDRSTALHDLGYPISRATRSALLGVRHCLVAPRYHRYAHGGHQPPRLGLVAHLADGLRRRADKGQARAVARLGEPPVLGEEAVAGMDRIGMAHVRSLEDPVDAQVTVAGRRRADRHGLIGVPDMRRVAIGLGKDRDRLQAQLPARAEHPPRDLPPIGDQDGADQGRG
jgi:hypothetical protein